MTTGQGPARARITSPAAAAGQEEPDEEVMLGMGIDVVDAEHGRLESGGEPSHMLKL
jgi:hypothetical protein